MRAQHESMHADLYSIVYNAQQSNGHNDAGGNSRHHKNGAKHADAAGHEGLH